MPDKSERKLKIFASREEINARVQEMADSISGEYGSDFGKLVLVCVDGGAKRFLDLVLDNLNGNGMPFIAHIKTQRDPTRKDKSYSDVPKFKYAGGVVQDNGDGTVRSRIDLSDKTIIVLDDIVYSGKTLRKIGEILESMGAKSVKNYVMIDARPKDKKGKNADVRIDGALLVGGDGKAIIGVGMDFAKEPNVQRNGGTDAQRGLDNFEIRGNR